MKTKLTSSTPIAAQAGSAIPRASTDEASVDWKLSVDWLKSIADAVEQATEERPPLEMTEDIVMALIAGGWATVEPPNTQASDGAPT